MTDTINYASGPDTETYSPFQLLAGDSPDVVTAPETLLTGTNYAARTVLGRVTASGKLKTWNPAATDGSQVAIGFNVYAVDATGGDVVAEVYKAGCFNTAALVWPSGVTTLVAQQAAFDRSPIVVKSLRYSG